MNAPLPNVPALDHMPRRQKRTLAMGLLAQTRGEYAEAMRCYEAAATRDKTCFLSLYFASLTAFMLKDKERAIRLMFASLHRNPQHPEAWYNLGKFYQDEGNIQRAAECYVAALEHRADFGQALVNLGNVMWELGDEATAESCYEQALTARDGGPEAVYNLSFLKQLRGDWPAAFEAMEARWQCAGYYVEYRKPFMEELPRWRGEQLLPNQRLLLHGEQGAGDQLQMLRYVPLVVEAVGIDKLTLAVFDSMVSLCQSSFPGVHVIGTDGYIGDCTHQLPSMSLPYQFKTSWTNPPPPTPYLKAEATLPKSARYRIALCWAGSKTHPRDKTRSMPVDLLRVLLTVPDVEWVNVQVGERQHDWLDAQLPAPVAQAEGRDYLETASLIQSCDLLISVDTSVCHLAGALGVDTWMLCARFPDVRWMLARADTPWYRSLQIFRQTVAGDWSELIAIVRQLLTYKVQFKDKGL